jgi:hypothetical protein
MPSKEQKKKGAGGRPSLFKPEYCDKVKQLCLLGATDKQMAELFDVSEQTFNTWKQKHPEFLESLTEGKAFADAKVAQSLFQRAIGYSHPDVHIALIYGAIRESKRARVMDWKLHLTS